MGILTNPRNSKEIQLSILLITYNRGKLLSQCLNSIASVLSNVNHNSVELIISDNNSSDNTPNIIRDWVSGNSSLKNIKVFRQSENIGGIRNLTSTLARAKGKYAVFIGDDDGLDSDGLDELLQVFSLDSNFSIGIEVDATSSPGKLLNIANRLSQIDSNYFAKGSPFYKFGNSWSGIYDVEACKRILSDASIREVIESSIWGQTLLGFLSANATKKPIALVGNGYGFQLVSRPFTLGGASALHSLSDLTRMAFKLLDLTEEVAEIPESLYKKWNSPINTHLYILLNSTPKDLEKKMIKNTNDLRNEMFARNLKLPLTTRLLFDLCSSKGAIRLIRGIRIITRRNWANSKDLLESSY